MEMVGKRRSKEEEENLEEEGLRLDLKHKTKIPREEEEEEQPRDWYGESDSSDDVDSWFDPEGDLKLRFRSGVAVYYEDDDQERVDDERLFSIPEPLPYAGDNEENWALPGILVTVHKLGEDSSPVGVVQEVHPDGSCSVALKSNKDEDEELLIARHSEMKIIPPKVSDKIKIIGGVYRGVSGELIEVERTEGTVLVDHSPNVMIVEDMDIIATSTHV